MNRDQAIAVLRAHEPELRAAGVELLSVFGSVARGEATGGSDVDVVVRLTPGGERGRLRLFRPSRGPNPAAGANSGLFGRRGHRTGPQGTPTLKHRTRGNACLLTEAPKASWRRYTTVRPAIMVPSAGFRCRGLIPVRLISPRLLRATRRSLNSGSVIEKRSSASAEILV